MPTDATVARRYARALYDLGGESGQRDDVAAALARSLDLFTSGDPPLLVILASPAFTLAERRAMVERLVKPAAIHPLVRSFLLLLLDRHRIGLLPEIQSAWRTLADLDARRVRAIMAAARPMDPAAVNDVRRTLAGLTGGPVEVTTHTDPSLVGGVVVQMGDTVWDASLRSRLEAMERALLSTHPAGTPST
ncbi:MAG: ATP synthase F1 subunit delta [Deltaproteobacteria bacterium]|nr:ATP synthase F1 subunit delta [Deltaproteobacteria bacterium]